MWENFTCGDPNSKESVEGTYEFFENSHKFGQQRGFPMGMERANSLCRGSDGKEFPKEKREEILAKSPTAHVLRYQQKIREAFNPNDLGEAHDMTVELKK